MAQGEAAVYPLCIPQAVEGSDFSSAPFAVHPVLVAAGAVEPAPEGGSLFARLLVPAVPLLLLLALAVWHWPFSSNHPPRRRAAGCVVRGYDPDAGSNAASDPIILFLGTPTGRGSLLVPGAARAHFCSPSFAPS